MSIPFGGDQSLMTYYLMFEIPPAVNRELFRFESSAGLVA